MLEKLFKVLDVMALIGASIWILFVLYVLVISVFELVS